MPERATLERLPTLVHPLSGLHSQMIKYERYPEGKEFPYGSGTNRKLADQDCRKYEDTVLHRMGAIKLHRNLCDRNGATLLLTDVHLTQLGQQLLAALNSGQVWNVSAESINPVQTRYHWLGVIRDNNILTDAQLGAINGLPDNGNYRDVKGALTYWLLTATPRTRATGGKVWVRDDGSSVIDHKWPQEPF